MEEELDKQFSENHWWEDALENLLRYACHHTRLQTSWWYQYSKFPIYHAVRKKPPGLQVNRPLWFDWRPLNRTAGFCSHIERKRHFNEGRKGGNRLPKPVASETERDKKALNIFPLEFPAAGAFGAQRVAPLATRVEWEREQVWIYEQVIYFSVETKALRVKTCAVADALHSVRIFAIIS